MQPPERERVEREGTVKHGTDYSVLYPPLPSNGPSSNSAESPGKLDISLLHALHHDSVVCCVRFSRDGKWLATVGSI